MNLSPQIHEMPHLKGNTVHCDPDILYASNSTTGAFGCNRTQQIHHNWTNTE